MSETLSLSIQSLILQVPLCATPKAETESLCLSQLVKTVMTRWKIDLAPRVPVLVLLEKTKEDDQSDQYQ